MQTMVSVLKWGSKIHSYGELKSYEKEVFSMKKTMTRVLSLVLVLAMFVSAVPLALADEEPTPVPMTGVELTAPSGDIIAGGSYTIGAAKSPSNTTEKLVWTSSDETIATVSKGTLNALKAGTVTITASSPTVATASNSIEITIKYAPSTPADMEVAVGQEVAVPALSVPGLDAAQYTVVWSSNNANITVDNENGKITGVTEGASVLTATVTPVAPVTEAEFVTLTASCAVSVVKAQSTVVTPSIRPTELELYLGDEIPMPILSGMGDLAVGADKDYTVTWASSNTEIVTVDAENGKFKAVGTGEVDLTATIKLLKEGFTFAEEKTEVVLTCKLTVLSGIVLEVKDPIEITKSGKYELKAPTLKGTNLTGLKIVSYEYTLVTGNKVNTSLSSKTPFGKDQAVYTLTGLSTGRDTLVVTAKVKANNGTGAEIAVPALEVPVSVYAVNEDITAVVKDTVKSFSFDQENVLSSLKLGDNEVLSTYKSLENLLLHLNADHTADRAADHGYYEVLFSNDVSDGGKLVYSDQWDDYDITVKVPNMKYLVYVKFIKDENKVAKSSFDYKVVDDKGLAIMTGTLYIDYAGSSQISYATDFETPVTFEEEDFEKFWATYGTGKSLRYIKFSNLPSSIYGKLWTDEDKTTAVNASTMLFAPDVSYGSAYYDLDTVTFVPAVRSAAYTVTIPFTAVDILNGSVTGAVSITVSKGSKLTITNLGLRLGQTGAKLDDVIAADFKKATDETLDYLTFVLPEVEQGRLVYDFNRNYDTLLTAEDVLATDKLYYSPGSSEKVMDLADVWFFPAAGASGNIKLAYTAVGEGGAIYQGFITLNVSVKTKSQYFTDVKSGSYSWAADAVDFLRYHGVVNGTNADNTTFSPANSITRAHFMLMLYRAFLADDYADFDVTSNFPDIPKGTDAYSKELYQAVGVAKYLGITNGSDGKYLPNKNISREEAMTLIYRTLDILDLNLRYTSDNETRDFSDYNKVSAYAKDPLKYLIEHGVVLGTDGKINPKSNITRAEMAVILHRVLTY